MPEQQQRYSTAPLERFTTAASIAEGPGLAHDAKNLMHALGLYCDLLQQPSVLSEQHRHYATEIRLLAQRSSALMHRLLDQVPVHSPDRKAPPEPPRPEVVTSAFGPLLRSLTAPDVEFWLDIESSLPRLAFPAEVLERILVNLISNAAAALRLMRPSRRATGRPRVHILLSGDTSHLCLRVRDNGPGMSASKVRAFLQPSPSVQGSGLGHRVVHELVQSTGGRLSLSSTRSTGTEITIQWTVPQLSP